jgi:non-heme chloroperoxidase
MAYLTVNGVELFYEDEGAGQPVVFLHGWGTSGRVWGGQLPDLVQDHRVITVDWRGCGRSTRPVAGNSIADIARDILELVSALALPAPVLVGSSIAGAFVIEAALAEPARLGGIVLVDAGVHFFSQGLGEQMRDLLAALRADRAGTLAAIVPNWFRPDASAALHDWTVRQILDSGVFIDQLIADQARYDPRSRLGELAVPVTFLHGELDAEVPREVPEQCAALIPGAEVILVEGAGHISQQDQPALFSRALRTALRHLVPALPRLPGKPGKGGRHPGFARGTARLRSSRYAARPVSRPGDRHRLPAQTRDQAESRSVPPG